MLKIGDFSKLSRVSIRMLRHYDEIGLLVPQSIDSITGYRHYSESQLPIANRIHALREMGFSLSVTAEILKTYRDAEAFRQYLLLKRTEMLEQEEKIGRQLLLLETAITRLGKDENVMEYMVALKEMPGRTVASLRKIIPAYDQEGILWEQLRRELGPHNVQFSTPCNATAVFYDEGYKDVDPDVEVQISVNGTYQNTENVVFKTVPAIQIASATYQGSYEQVNDVYEAVANWVKDNHYDFNGPMFSIYHVSPAQTQNPDELVTEVCFPVKKK